MRDAILACNAGSSTIKFALYHTGQPEPALLARGLIDHDHEPAHVRVETSTGEYLLDDTLPITDLAEQFHWITEWLTTSFRDVKLVGAGHRVVHGGEHFIAPVLVDDDVMKQLTALNQLAPLHQPHNLAAIAAFATAIPGLPQVACFDTAFHHSNPLLTTLYALPQELTKTGIRRYGFHGLSYDYITGQLPSVAGSLPQRVVVAHLGSGASLCALHKGRSIASSMGFSALDGIPMATRSGNLDPGVLLYLMCERGMDYNALSKLLYHQSGLLGLSGISGDMRVLESSTDASARQAIDLFVYRISREIGSLVAALGGLDALVFTGGIGEHSASLRTAVCEQAAWLGVDIDKNANQKNTVKLHSVNSRIAVYVIPTNENQVIARATQTIIGN